MNPELRRFPRISFDEPGQLTIPAKGDDSSQGTQHVAVRLRSISCQGAGLTVTDEDAARIQPGMQVQLSFSLEGQTFAIPARVVWSAGSKIGLRLRLGHAEEAIRRAYAAWIVPLTNKEIVKQRTRTGS